MAKEVILKMYFDTLEPIDFDTQLDAIDIGGYSFIMPVQDKEDAFIELNFDFDASGYSKIQHDNGTLSIEYASGQGFMFNDYDLSEDFKEEYEELGLAWESLTAEFLANPKSINEIFIGFLGKGTDYIPVAHKITEIIFYNENCVEYHVSKEIIDAYNEQLAEEIAKWKKREGCA